MEQCYCENIHCKHCLGKGCSNPASTKVKCDYIGNICDTCATFMLGEHLHPIIGITVSDPVGIQYLYANGQTSSELVLGHSVYAINPNPNPVHNRWNVVSTFGATDTGRNFFNVHGLTMSQAQQVMAAILAGRKE